MSFEIVSPSSLFNYYFIKRYRWWLLYFQKEAFKFREIPTFFTECKVIFLIASLYPSTLPLLVFNSFLMMIACFFFQIFFFFFLMAFIFYGPTYNEKKKKKNYPVKLTFSPIRIRRLLLVCVYECFSNLKRNHRSSLCNDYCGDDRSLKFALYVIRLWQKNKKNRKTLRGQDEVNGKWRTCQSPCRIENWCKIELGLCRN